MIFLAPSMYMIIDVQAFVTGYGALSVRGGDKKPYACWTDGAGPVRYTP